MHGTNYLDRDIEFCPLIPVALNESSLCDYLKREFPDLGLEIGEEGGVSLRLGPNQMLGPVAGRIAFVYKLLIKKYGDNSVSKQANSQKLQGH